MTLQEVVAQLRDSNERYLRIASDFNPDEPHHAGPIKYCQEKATAMLAAADYIEANESKNR